MKTNREQQSESGISVNCVNIRLEFKKKKKHEKCSERRELT